MLIATEDKRASMKPRSGSLRSATSVTLAALVCVATVMGCANQPKREVGWCALGGAAIGTVVGGALGIGIGGYKGLANCCHHDSETTAVISDTMGVAGGFLIGGVIGHYYCDPVVEAPPPPPASAGVPATPRPGDATASK